MLNVNEQRIQEIKEGRKLIDKNYELLRDSKLYRSHDSVNAVTFKRLNTTELFKYRHYVFNETELLVGQKVGTKYHYHSAVDSQYSETFTDTKRPKVDKFNNEGRTDLSRGSYVKNLVTGNYMYVTSTLDGEPLSASDRRLDINKNISIDCSTYSSRNKCMIGDIMIEHNKTTYGGDSYRLVSDSIEEGKSSALSSDDISKMVREYLETLGFSKVKEIPSHAIRVGVGRFNNSPSYYSNCDVAYNKEDDSFYIRRELKYSYLYYSIKAKEFNGLKYMCIDSDFFYLNEDTIEYAFLNTEYSASIQNHHIILSEDEGIKFLDKPRSRYFRRDKDLLVYKDNSIDVNNITATIDTEFSMYTVSSSNLEIVSEFSCDKQVIPIKIPVDGTLTTFYVIADDNGFYMYLYPGQDRTYTNVLTEPKYLKFNRKKSNICLYNDLILVSYGDGDFEAIKQDDFIIDSIQTIGMNNFRIKGKDGYDYVSNRRGLFKLEFPYEDYDFVSISSTYGSNVVTIRNGAIKVNNISIEPFGADSVVVKDVDSEPIFLEHTTIEVDDESNVNLRVAYPYDTLKHNANTFLFNVTEGRFIWNDDKADIKLENDHIVVYALRKSIHIKGDEVSTDTYYFYSKLSEECISSDTFNPQYRYFSDFAEVYSKDVFNEIPGYIYVHGYFVKKDLFNSFGNSSESFIKRTVDIMNTIDIAIYSNEEATEFLKKSFYDGLVAEAQAHGLNITKEDIFNCPLPRELNLILTSIDNLSSSVSRSKYKEILTEIENQLKGKPTLQSELFETQNLINESSFKSLGLSLDKFNNFDTTVDFQASSGDGAALKNSICSDMYSQFEILLGSRSKGKKGFLQLNNPNTICTYLETYMDVKVRLASITTDTKGEPVSDATLVKEINKLGFKFFGLLKKYNISLDLVNDTFVIAGKNAKDVRFEKLISIAKDFIQIKDKVLNDIDKNQIFNNALKVALDKFIEWSVGHVKEAVKNIESKNDISDDTVEDLQIRLWDRHNILEALTQGSKTHCCLAVNSFNIDKLVQYIYNKNINLVEIRNKHGVIGQAFVSLYKTRNKLNYRYEYKQHLFMIIDNIELNNSYSKYHDDIARNLQKFMNLYMLHTSDKISDVFLGTSMNDIRPPYEFRQSIHVDLIGARGLYLDHSNVFYKFL